MESTLKNFTAETTIQDLIENPRRYGLPTYAEYSFNPDKWKIDIMAIIDSSSKQLRKIMKKQKYKVCGVPCKTLEQAETLAIEMGHDIRLMNFKPEVQNIGGQWCEIEVSFEPKELNIPTGGQSETV